MNSLVKTLFLKLGGDAVLRTSNRVPRILFWHGVDERQNPMVEQEIFDIDVFKQQISYLKKHYEIISMDEFERRFVTNQYSGKEVVLTFDDGYANNLYVVAPILKDFGFPFTVFVSAEHVEKGLYFPTSVNRIIMQGSNLRKVTIPSCSLEFDLTDQQKMEDATKHVSDLLKTQPIEQVRVITQELIDNVSSDEWEVLKEKFKSVRPMTWEEVRQLSESGATIGSHCMWHICCHSNQNDTEVEYQLRESKRQIEEHIGKECKYFAYPNGDNTDFSNRIVSEYYSLGFSTKGLQCIKNNCNKAIIPRIGMPANIDTFRIVTNLYPKK